MTSIGRSPQERDAAALVARYTKKRKWRPDLVWCSPPARVRESWQVMTPVLGLTVDRKTLRTIYPGAPSRLLQALRRATDQVGTLMLVGHNPGLGRLTAGLCGTGPERPLERMRSNFSSAALALIDFDVERWDQMAPGAGRLRAFL